MSILALFHLLIIFNVIVRRNIYTRIIRDLPIIFLHGRKTSEPRNSSQRIQLLYHSLARINAQLNHIHCQLNLLIRSFLDNILSPNILLSLQQYKQIINNCIIMEKSFDDAIYHCDNTNANVQSTCKHIKKKEMKQ